jgi:hypothetical protein
VVSKAARFEPTSSARNEGRKSLRRQPRLDGEKEKNRRERTHETTLNQTTLYVKSSFNEPKEWPVGGRYGLDDSQRTPSYGSDSRSRRHGSVASWCASEMPQRLQPEVDRSSVAFPVKRHADPWLNLTAAARGFPSPEPAVADPCGKTWPAALRPGSMEFLCPKGIVVGRGTRRYLATSKSMDKS